MNNKSKELLIVRDWIKSWMLFNGI